MMFSNHARWIGGGIGTVAALVVVFILGIFGVSIGFIGGFLLGLFVSITGILVYSYLEKP